MSAPSRLEVFVCPECGEQIERLYIPRGHYHGDPSDMENRRFVKAEEVTVYLAPYFGNFSPPLRYRLTVHGEVAEGSEEEMNALLRWVEAEMADQWRRDLYAKEAVT